MKAHGLRVEDCLCLLAYVSRHRGEPQSYRLLDEATGIPHPTIEAIVRDAREQGQESLLWGVAHHEGYSFYLYPRRGWEGGLIIDVEHRLQL